jgi:hypothetical protein
MNKNSIPWWVKSILLLGTFGVIAYKIIVSDLSFIQDLDNEKIKNKMTKVTARRITKDCQPMDIRHFSILKK